MEEEPTQIPDEIGQIVLAYFANLRGGRCPVCGQPVTEKQVGSCVYGEPCGHRLYQGRAGAFKESQADDIAAEKAAYDAEVRKPYGD